MKTPILISLGAIASASVFAQIPLYYENFSIKTTNEAGDGLVDDGIAGWNYVTPDELDSIPQQSSGWIGRRDASTNPNGATITGVGWDLPFENNPNVDGLNNNQVLGADRGVLRWAPTGNQFGIAMWSTEFSVAWDVVTAFNFWLNTSASVTNSVYALVKVDGTWYASEESVQSTSGSWSEHTITKGLFTETTFDEDGPDNPFLSPFTNFVEGASPMELSGSTLEGYGIFVPAGYIGEQMGELNLDDFTILGIPEPSTMGLLGLVLPLAFLAYRRR